MWNANDFDRGMFMNIQIANRLVELRKQNGLSQEELAAQLGVSRQAVSKWERAESSPDTDNLIGLSRIYSISLDDLLLNSANNSGAQTQSQPSAEEAPEPADGHDYTNYADDATLRYDIEWEKEQRQLRRKRFLHFPYPVFVSLCYLIMGFQFGLWHPGWMIFLTIPIYYGMASAI
jgi:transcriptional regulator with XRE-family HTH domain